MSHSFSNPLVNGQFSFTRGQVFHCLNDHKHIINADAQKEKWETGMHIAEIQAQVKAEAKGGPPGHGYPHHTH